MEIKEIKTTQERVIAFHEGEVYTVTYTVTLNENKTYQSIEGVIRVLEQEEPVAYVNKSWEMSLRIVQGKEDLFSEISVFAAETLDLLDASIKSLI